MSRGIGVDACPYGWCVTKLDGDSISIDIVEQFAEILVAHPDTPILVDIPIVLPTTSRRRCDEGAKDILGCRGGSVFYTICEAAISIDDYDEAKKVHKNNIGHRLSQQAFSVGRKIRQVRDTVGDTYDGRIRESHPELCFFHLNQQPVAYAKSSERGLKLRLALLESEINGARATYDAVVEDRLRKVVRKDDILDSIALAIAARHDELATTPSDPGDNEPRIYYPPTEIPELE